MHKLIDFLQHKQWLWHGNATPLQALHAHSSGFPELDQHLAGGFPEQGLVALQSEVGIGELRLLCPYLQSSDPRLVVLINPPGQLCAEFALQLQRPLNQFVQLATDSQQAALWAAEQCLKSGSCQHVLLWQPTLAVHQSKRLQLASERGDALCWWFTALDANASSLPVTLALTLRPSAQGLQCRITKRKGGWSQTEFNINLQSRWPELTPPTTTEHVLPFVLRKSS